MWNEANVFKLVIFCWNLRGKNEEHYNSQTGWSIDIKIKPVFLESENGGIS